MSSNVKKSFVKLYCMVEKLLSCEFRILRLFVSIFSGALAQEARAAQHHR